jgi:flagellar biosynthesis protein FlhF
MRIKKYIADSMPEALKQVKADLGSQAVILNTRTLRKSGKLGLGGKGQVEVTAAIDESGGALIKKRPAKKVSPPAPGEAVQPSPSRPISRSIAQTLPGSTPDPKWADRITQKLEGLEAAMRTSSSRPQEKLLLPGALDPLAEQLRLAGLSDALAQDVLKALLLDPGPGGLKDLAPLQKRAGELMGRWFENPQPTRLGNGVRSIVALVGSAGVGKTTAAARMAAHFSETGARVLLVAADTDRIGGLEQIRAYAGILGVPIEVVYTADEMGDLIRERRDVDLILIDTGGVGPLDQARLLQLEALLKEAAPNEVHLTLAATADLQQMHDVVAAFERLGVNRLLLTKIDETARLGMVCAAAVASKLPMSYLTNGRAVPGDFQQADPSMLVACLFEGVSHVSR